MNDAFFGSPYNWCDSACGRCPVAGECPLVRRLEGRRWAHEMRGVDPDAPEVVMGDVAEDLERSMQLLARVADEEGIDLDSPAPESPRPLLAARMGKVGRSYALCVRSLIDEAERLGHGDGDALDGVAGSALLVAAKAARIATHVPSDGSPDGPAWLEDAVPNLLVVELLMAEVDAIVARLGAALSPEAVRDFDRARDELQRALAPTIAAVPPEPRAAMAALVAAGRAPSPFCKSPPG